MFEIIGRLEESGFVHEVEVLELVDKDDVKYLRLRAALKDGGLFYLKELEKPDYISYSYHLQDKDGKLIVRWDNSPHYKNVETFPHHMHFGGRVKPTFKPTIDELLKYLADRLKMEGRAR